MQHILRIAIPFFFLNFTGLTAQNKIQIHVQSQVHVSSKDNLLPLYQYSNQWGIISPFEQGQALIMVGGKYKFLDKKNVELEFGMSAVAKNKVDDSFLHEAYFKGRILNTFDFCLGKQANTPISINDKLTTGGFMMNSNARPIPRAKVGMFDYWPVSFLADLIEVKGGLSHGVLNDNRTSAGRGNSADNVLVHEKWTYVRLGKIKVKPYVGLFHGTLYGGIRPNGYEIPTDFWATFFANGSDKVGGGEATNAAGAHDGFWDIGINYESSLGYFQVYIHKPYADGTGLKINKERNKDYKVGLYVDLKNTKRIKKISVELIKTDYQAGSGIPDPLYPEGHQNAGEMILVDEIEDYDIFMLDVFGVETEGYTSWHLMRYLEKVQNHGKKYGSRDDYNNNGTYYNAWTYNRQPMGLPLYHTYWQAKAYAPNWIPNNFGAFMNNRIQGFHIGLEGELSNLSYLFKSTYTFNKGTYGEQYIRRYSWVEDPDFFYKEGKGKVYTYLSLTYKSKKWQDVNFQGSISYDFGELYNAFGCSLGISYSPSINF